MLKNFGLNILGGYKQAEQLGTITEQIFKKLSANILIYIKNKQHHFLKNVLRIKKEDCINLFHVKH